MTGPSSSAAGKTKNGNWFLQLLAIFFVIATIAFFLVSKGVLRPDEYVKATLSSKGSIEKGEQLFLMNCVGCHGISAQGFLGPDLHDMSSKLSEKQIINQILKGRTPPMPSFEMEPEVMADLLAYLESLS